MRTQSLRFVLFLLILSLLASPASGDRPDMLAQADLGQSLSCPYGGVGPFLDTDAVVTLRTKGAPVIVMATVDVSLSPGGGFLIRPTVDGAPADNAFATHFIGSGTAEGERTTLSFSRAYEVAAGIHTFRLQYSCQNGANATAGWLTVFELR